MNKAEFVRGWILLTTQPWGKPYRSSPQRQLTGEPEPADIQSQFYFDSLKAWDASTWIKVCEEYARGNKWPSIDDLKDSLSSYNPMPQSKALPAPEPEYCSATEAFKEAPYLKERLEKLLGRSLA